VSKAFSIWRDAARPLRLAEELRQPRLPVGHQNQFA
jgi:hypothetical protein